MSKVDDELTRRLHRAERPVDDDRVFEEVVRRRSHRERVRGVQAGLLAFAVLAGTAVGFVALQQAFTRNGQTTGSTRSPALSPRPPQEGRNIGLGFNVCNVERLGGIDWYGAEANGSAWTGARIGDDGRCPPDGEGGYVVAADLDGDGSAEPSIELLHSCVLCRPFAATDLNADGSLELVILEEASSTPSYSIYGVTSPGSGRTPGVSSLIVAPPGAPHADIPANEQFRFMVGGDEGFSGGLRCENYPQAPVLIYTWLFGEVDANSDLQGHEARLRLGQEGVFHVLDSKDFMLPRDVVSPQVVGVDPACGVDFHPAA